MRKISERAKVLFENHEEKREFPQLVRFETLMAAIDEWQASVEERLVKQAALHLENALRPAPRFDEEKPPSSGVPVLRTQEDADALFGVGAFNLARRLPKVPDVAVFKLDPPATPTAGSCTRWGDGNCIQAPGHEGPCRPQRPLCSPAGYEPEQETEE